MSVKYCDKLPRRCGKRRCQHLDSDGERCMKQAVIETSLHEEQEHHGRWVTVCLCQDHCVAYDLKTISPRRS